MLRNPASKGIIFEKFVPRSEERKELPPALLEIIDYANSIFEAIPTAEALGVNSGLTRKLPNSKNFNVLVNNSDWNGGEGITESLSEKHVHEIGHNFCAEFRHGSGE